VIRKERRSWVLYIATFSGGKTEHAAVYPEIERFSHPHRDNLQAQPGMAMFLAREMSISVYHEVALKHLSSQREGDSGGRQNKLAS